MEILGKTVKRIWKRWLGLKIQWSCHGDIGDQVHHHTGEKKRVKGDVVLLHEIQEFFKNKIG